MAAKTMVSESPRNKVLFLLRASLAEYLLYTKYWIRCLAQGLHLTSQEAPEEVLILFTFYQQGNQDSSNGLPKVTHSY